MKALWCCAKTVLGSLTNRCCEAVHRPWRIHGALGCLKLLAHEHLLPPFAAAGAEGMSRCCFLLRVILFPMEGISKECSARCMVPQERFSQRARSDT